MELQQLQKRESELKLRHHLYDELGNKNKASNVNYLALIQLISVQKEIIKIEVKAFGHAITQLQKFN